MTITRGWNRRRALGALVTGAALALGLASVTMQSYAAIVAQADAASGTGDLIVEAQPHPTEFFDLSPGQSRYWSIEASLSGAESGSLALQVFGAGALIEHPQHPLTIAIEGCDGMLVGDDPREHPVCKGAAYTSIIAEQPLTHISSDPAADGATHVWTLPDIIGERARSFVVTLALPESGSDDKTLMGLRGQIGVGLFAAGDDAGAEEPPRVTDPPDDLARTGRMLPVSLLLIAAGTIGLGFLLRRVHARPQCQASRRSP